MRARFTDSIASSLGWRYHTGQEVSVLGADYLTDVVPESAGLAWLSDGLLEPVEASVEVATVAPARTAKPPIASNTIPRQRPERARR